MFAAVARITFGPALQRPAVAAAREAPEGLRQGL